MTGLNRPGHFDVSVDALVELLSALSQGGKPLQQHVPLAAMLTQHIVALRPRFLVVARRLQAERDGTEVAHEAGTLALHVTNTMPDHTLHVTKYNARQ